MIYPYEPNYYSRTALDMTFYERIRLEDALGSLPSHIVALVWPVVTDYPHSVFDYEDSCPLVIDWTHLASITAHLMHIPAHLGADLYIKFKTQKDHIEHAIKNAQIDYHNRTERAHKEAEAPMLARIDAMADAMTADDILDCPLAF